MSEAELAEKVVTELQLVRKRTALYVGSNDPRAVLGYIYGMASILKIYGYANLLSQQDLIITEVQDKREWIAPEGHMARIEKLLESGVDSASIVNEIVEIQVQAIRERFDLP